MNSNDANFAQYFWFTGSIQRLRFWLVALVAYASSNILTSVAKNLHSSAYVSDIELAGVMMICGATEVWCNACNISRRLRDIGINPLNAIGITIALALIRYQPNEIFHEIILLVDVVMWSGLLFVPSGYFKGSKSRWN